MGLSNPMPPYPPAPAGTTVELLDGSISAQTDQDGNWTLPDVPVTREDPFLKVSAPGYAPMILVFPLSKGYTEFDLAILDNQLYTVIFGVAPGGPYDTSKACLVLGAGRGAA